MNALESSLRLVASVASKLVSDSLTPIKGAELIAMVSKETGVKEGLTKTLISVWLDGESQKDSSEPRFFTRPGVGGGVQFGVPNSNGTAHVGKASVLLSAMDAGDQRFSLLKEACSNPDFRKELELMLKEATSRVREGKEETPTPAVKLPTQTDSITSLSKAESLHRFVLL